MAESFISWKDMTESLSADLRHVFREVLPMATVAALTRTAIKCRDEMKNTHMPRLFDRPTPYALNATRAVPATLKSMTSAVLLREFGKGTKAEDFLGPEIDGGPRRQKREERAFAVKGFLQSGGFLAPGSGAAIDQYGNEPSSEIRRIMSVLRAFGEQGYHANRTKHWVKKTRVGQIFVVRAGAKRGGLKPGVYRRKEGGAVECLQMFLKKPPTYHIRLPLDSLVQTDAARFFPAELDLALRQAPGWKK